VKRTVAAESMLMRQLENLRMAFAGRCALRKVAGAEYVAENPVAGNEIQNTQQKNLFQAVAGRGNPENQNLQELQAVYRPRCCLQAGLQKRNAGVKQIRAAVAENGERTAGRQAGAAGSSPGRQAPARQAGRTRRRQAVAGSGRTEGNEAGLQVNGR